MKKQVLWGILLLLAGAYFLLAALFDLPGGIFLVFLGLAFLLARLVSGRAGLTIPGCLLFWLGAGQTLQHYFGLTNSEAAVFFLSLSLGFLFIHILDFKKLGNWPLIPALALFVAGAALIVIQDPYLYNMLKPYFSYIVPCALIVVGAGILISGLVRSGRKKAAQRAKERAQQQYVYTNPPQQDDNDPAFVFEAQEAAQERPKEEPAAPQAEAEPEEPKKEETGE